MSLGDACEQIHRMFSFEAATMPITISFNFKQLCHKSNCSSLWSFLIFFKSSGKNLFHNASVFTIKDQWI